MDIPDTLINLERSAEAEHAKLAGLDGEQHQAQWKAWRAAAEALQAAVTEHAQTTGQSRNELEQAVKKAVRHDGPEAA